jgi:hypothetical protein
VTIQQQPLTYAGDDAPTEGFQLPRQRHAVPAEAPVASPPQPVWQAQPQQPRGQQKPPKKRRRWPWVLGGLFAFIMIITIANSGGSNSTTPAAPAAAPAQQSAASAPTAASSASAAAPATNTTQFTSGTYQVGSDIQPGRYKTPGGSFCGWSRDSSDDGQLSSIIANDIVQGPGSVTIKSSDKFVEFSGDCTWTKQ